MDIQQAFETLTGALRSELEAAKAEGAQAFEEGHFEAAQQAATTGKAIETILEEVRRVALQWEALQSPQISSFELGKPALGPISTEDDFVVAILHALDDMGGKGDAEAVLSLVERLAPEGFTLEDADGLDDGRPHGWRDSLPSTHQLMVKQGYIYSGSSQGVWQLTPKGRLYLYEQRD